jgi:hypothetical protein
VYVNDFLLVFPNLSKVYAPNTAEHSNNPKTRN